MKSPGSTNGIGPRDRLPVVIRAAAPRDLPGLLRMSRGGVSLDLPETLLGDYTPVKGLAQGRWLPLGLSRQHVRTYVARCAAAPCAFVQARGRVAQHKWDILYLGATGRGPVATPGGRIDLWTALLDYTTAAAGRRGIRRLYAKLAADAEAAAAFRAAGYARYGEETIYLLHGGAQRDLPDDGPDESAVRIRAQTPADTWALHQLYNWTAPKPAQYAEAYTSHRWELAGQGRLRRTVLRGGLREWGFLVERGNEIAVYCRVGRQGKRVRLGFVFQPDGRDLLGPALGVVLRWLAPGRGERVYCTAQEFQQELGAVLEARGFTPIGSQDLLVRHTTVASRVRAARAWPAVRLKKVRAGVPVS